LITTKSGREWLQLTWAGYNSLLRYGNRAEHNFFIRFGAGARERHNPPRSAA
jgi:hypothetical protein